MKSKVISLSAISAALIAVSLTIGAYFEFADLFAVVIASAFVILPIYLKKWQIGKKHIIQPKQILKMD